VVDITKETLTAMGLDLTDYSADAVRKEVEVRDANATNALNAYRKTKGIVTDKVKK